MNRHGILGLLLFMVGSYAHADVEWGSENHPWSEITGSKTFMVKGPLKIALHFPELSESDIAYPCNNQILIDNKVSVRAKGFYRGSSPIDSVAEFTPVPGDFLLNNHTFQILTGCYHKALQNRSTSVYLYISDGDGTAYDSPLGSLNLTAASRCAASIASATLNAGTFHASNGQQQDGPAFQIKNTGNQRTKILLKPNNQNDVRANSRFIMKNSEGVSIAEFTLNFLEGISCGNNVSGVCNLVDAAKTVSLKVRMEKLLSPGVGSATFTAIATCD